MGSGGRGVLKGGGYEGNRRFLRAGRLPGRHEERAFWHVGVRREIVRWRVSVRPCPVERGFVLCGVRVVRCSLGLGFQARFGVLLSLISGRVGDSARCGWLFGSRHC